MLEAGFEPNIFVLTSLIQCYGRAQLTSEVVTTFPSHSWTRNPQRE
uniref:Pentatricopeptide repeat-containing protein At4g16390ic n=1 Tax=Rhizophora mucronata TaxID=61149 RepID=A0A2P2MU81_RHIMU